MDSFIRMGPSCSSEQAAAFSDSILNMIVTDMRPLSMVEDKGFRRMILSFNPNYTLPSRSRTFFTKKMETFVAIPVCVAVMFLCCEAILQCAQFDITLQDFWVFKFKFILFNGCCCTLEELKRQVEKINTKSVQLNNKNVVFSMKETNVVVYLKRFILFFGVYLR